MTARGARRARVRALAKVNLDLRVLRKRFDDYHELRTIFQTVSLWDTLEFTYTPAAATTVFLDDPLAIPDNLILRATVMVLDAMGVEAHVRIRLTKQIPMGSGLGGGSSDAAAVLLTLPVLAGRPLPLGTVTNLACRLGSDVPFFLLGGRAVGIGRGEEVFPLDDLPAWRGLIVAPGVPVSTAEAYRLLSPRLTFELQQNKIFSFQSQAWDVSPLLPQNDFESVVFESRPELSALKTCLLEAGASIALMTGSGSAVFGIFRDAPSFRRALIALGQKPRLRRPADPRSAGVKVFRITLVGRRQYRAYWRDWLRDHSNGNAWPPLSLYA